MKPIEIYLRAISHAIPQLLITKIIIKVTRLNFISNLPGVNVLRTKNMANYCNNAHANDTAVLLWNRCAYLQETITHWGRVNVVIFQIKFSMHFLEWKLWISLKISPKFFPKVPIYNTPVFVQMMAWHRPVDKPLSEPVMDSLLTYICVTRPQWFKLLLGVLTHHLRWWIMRNQFNIKKQGAMLHHIPIHIITPAAVRFWRFDFRELLQVWWHE